MAIHPDHSGQWHAWGLPRGRRREKKEATNDLLESHPASSLNRNSKPEEMQMKEHGGTWQIYAAGHSVVRFLIVTPPSWTPLFCC